MKQMMENNKAAHFKVIENGPLEVSGSFTITGPDGKMIEIDGPVELCRCGESKNKPFCDDSHKENGFCG